MPFGLARVAWTLISIAGLASPSFAERNEAFAPLLGEWSVRIDGGGEIYTAQMTLKASNDGSVSGVYETDGDRGAIRDVRLEEDGLFVVEVENRLRGMEVFGILTFELIDGRMDGDIDLEFGTRVRSYEFEAERDGAPPATSVASNRTDKESVAPVHGLETIEFRNGEGGYDGAIDTEIWAIAPSKPLDRQGTLTADGNNGGGESQVLMRFGDVFGDEEGQAPLGAVIERATLEVVAFDPGSTVYLHRVFVPWSAAATWDRMSAGMSVDAVEASRVRDGFSFGAITMDKQLVQFDVTQTVQAWANGEENHGWVFVNTGGNGWDFYSSDWIETDLRPKLKIELRRR